MAVFSFSYRTENFAALCRLKKGAKMNDLDNEFDKEAFERFEQMFQNNEYDSSYCAEHSADILHYASSCDRWELMRWIISKEKNIRRRANLVQKVLFAAVKEGQMDMVQWAVARGAEINAKDSNGKTAMQYAREIGNEQCIKWLLEQSSSGSKIVKNAFMNFHGRRNIMLLQINNNRDLSDLFFDPENSKFIDQSSKDSEDEE